MNDLLCEEEEPIYLGSFDPNDSFLKNLSKTSISPSFEYILFNYKKSLFSKCLTAKVKIEKHKLLKLQMIQKSLIMNDYPEEEKKYIRPNIIDASCSTINTHKTMFKF